MKRVTNYVIYDPERMLYLNKRQTWTSDRLKAWTSKNPETMRKRLDKYVMPAWFRDKLIISEQ